jgi:polysaccharide biosynthesis/export protein
VLTISVWREKDLQAEVAVRPDGGINFPLAGDIVVAGKTIEQIQKDIAAKLTRYVPDPVVTAGVKQSQGNKIYVVGKVNRPGEFASNRTIDVMQALSMAGGPNPIASVNKIKILRRVQWRTENLSLQVFAGRERQKSGTNIIVLQGGDIVVVPLHANSIPDGKKWNPGQIHNYGALSTKPHPGRNILLYRNTCGSALVYAG